MRFLGTQQEQKEEIRTMFKPYATEMCRDCLGTGEIGWSEQEQRYRICSCVLKNIDKIQKENVEIIN